jgi:putative ABC transport system permease protein
MLTYALATMQGMDDHFRDAIEATGPRIVYLFPGVLIKERVGERGARGLELEAPDVARMAGYESVEHASPNLLAWNQIVRGGGRTKLLSVFGVAPEALAIRNFQVAAGRFIEAKGVTGTERVAFLGAEAARRLFGGQPAVGQTVQIEGHGFRVCGVAVAKGEQLVGIGGKDDQAVLVPYTTAQRWLLKNDDVTQVVFAPVTRHRSFEAIGRIREVLGLHHGFAPSLDTTVSFVNVHEVLLIIDNLFLGVRVFMVTAGLVTLLVGAVSVMNIMLVVVAERTREIGLRKAVGAPGGAIFRAFLAEATTVCVLAGVLGSVLGIGLAEFVAGHMDESQRVISPPRVDPVAIVTLVAVLVAVGIASGVLPAWRAARIPPAEALRSH